MNSKISLIIILFVAAMLRLWNISGNPPSLTWDEVSIGYNAYSILKTGKDEHGKFLPLDTFVAYGDYKPPVAIYLTVPSIALFGLNEFGVRFPSALAGIIAVGLIYLVVQELFLTIQDTRNKKQETGNKTQEIGNLPSLNYGGRARKQENNSVSCFMCYVPYLVAIIMTFSPWHINLSRAGWEANIGLTLLLTGVLFMLKARHDTRYVYPSFAPFVLALYTFNSTRYVAPLLVLGLLFFGFREYRKHINSLIIAACIAAVMLIPIAPHLISKEARLRFTEVNIFTDASVVVKSNARLLKASNPIEKIFVNRRVGYAASYVKHFFDHFDPSYLFIKGDSNPKFSTQDVGEMYPFDAVFLLLGILSLLSQYPGVGLLLVYWIIISIMPAAVARETPHALRTINALPVYMIFIAFGIVTIWNRLKEFIERIQMTEVRKQIFQRLCLIMLIGGIGIYGSSVFFYLYNYHVQYPIEYAGEWQYGYKTAIFAIQKYDTGTQKIFISESIGRAYMYAAFYTRMNPDMFRSEKTSYFDAAGFYHVESIGRYVFGDIPDPMYKGPLIAVVLPGIDVPGAMKKETILLPNGVPVFDIYLR